MDIKIQWITKFSLNIKSHLDFENIVYNDNIRVYIFPLGWVVFPLVQWQMRTPTWKYSTALSMVLLSVVSATSCQPWSENIKWENSRNKQFLSLKLHSHLSSMKKSCITPLCLPWNITHTLPSTSILYMLLTHSVAAMVWIWLLPSKLMLRICPWGNSIDRLQFLYEEFWVMRTPPL